VKFMIKGAYRALARLWLARLLVVISFVLYTAAALSLHQPSLSPFYVEEDDPLPAVLSHWIYGLPLGEVDRGLETYFHSAEAAKQPVDVTVQGAFQRGAPPSGNIGLTEDGIGVGSFITANLAFSIFGPKARSLPIFFLSLLGISAAMFLIRFRDYRLVAVPIFFTGATLLSMTVVSVMPDAAQAPIGGARYFAILGILPALHWCFEFLDESEPFGPWATRRWAPLAVQAILMAIGILVRGSPLYLFIVVAIAGYVGYRRKRRLARVMPELMRCAVFGAVPLIAVIAGVLIAYPKYTHSGRTFGNVWHRAFISFAETNPTWPFPGLRETYDCTDVIPEGLSRDTPDRNGHCVWTIHERQLGVSASGANLKIYDGDYEAALRSAFFRLWRDYPRASFLTFFYYKPINIFVSAVNSVKIDIRSSAVRLIRWFVIGQMLILISIMCLYGKNFMAIIKGSTLFIVGLWACALLPQWLAWSSASTTTDTTVCALSAFAFGLSAMVAGSALKTVSAASGFRRRGVGPVL
jgi:hypothetical protein